MTNRQHYIPQNFVASDSDRQFGTGGGGVSRLDSENEDLRGVIDDLTVENKRLRQMIRFQHRQHRGTPSDASQNQDKLFEVRMHGLQPEKRRELEFLLKTFATSVHSTRASKPASASNASASASSSGQNIAQGKGPQTDSGYGSLPTSGHASILPSKSNPPLSATNKAIKTYLQDIPNTLLPRRSFLMSERAKQGLIVRRLEQLFTGRTASPGNHDQPQQQEEISQSAARADRAQDAKLNKKRKAEGHREARVMPPDTKINLDSMDYEETQDVPKLRKDASMSDGSFISRPGSPEQRPTRPLDLDIHRAQIAAENISYIHHLGLSSPQLGISFKEGEQSPWMFLNLLTGLAQLHTLNVTPDQIRKAIKKLSKRFELSKDGHKVRWIGGFEGTKFHADDEKAIEEADVDNQESAEDTGTGGSSKRSQSNSTSQAAMTSNTPSEDKTSGLQTSSDSKNQQLTTSGTSNLPSSTVPTKLTPSASAFDYKPIVYRDKLRADVDDGLRDSDESFDSQSGDSSGLVHALSKSNLNQKSKEEGLITFFDNPFFCSDFSAEREPSNFKSPRPALVGETLGIPVPIELCESPLRHHDATYFTTQFAPTPFDEKKLSEEQKQKFNKSLPQIPSLAPISEAGEEETLPMEMEVCGLGGVTPEDNFALDVKTEMSRASFGKRKSIVRFLPFSRRRYSHKFLTQVSSCERIDLLPSKLPPPSYIFFTSSSSEDGHDFDDDNEEQSSEDDTSSSPFIDEECPAPPTFLQQFSRSSGENMGDDEDEDGTSSEIDMLAIARRVNPEQIAEQERVYMITQPGGAQRAVAGSLAATVGASRTSSSVQGIAGPASSVSEHGSQEESDEEDDTDMLDD